MKSPKTHTRPIVWQEHFAAMERWRQRALSASQGSIVVESDGFLIDPTEALDFAKAYFVICHSFRDWLIAAEAVGKKELDSYLGEQESWKLLRDLANKVKHPLLTRNPSDPDWVASARIDLNAIIRGEHGLEPCVTHNGQYRPINECIDEIWELVRRVVTEFNLEITKAAVK